MNGPAPAVSVVIPCYNTAPWIAETLDSVFAQTYPDFEVILINDGSSDTEELEKAIAPYREKVIYLEQENRGPSAARNTGIRQARGEFVAFLDSDDSWFPNYLAEQMRAFDETPSLDLVYTDVLFYSDPSDPGIPYSRMYPSRGPVTFASVVRQTTAVVMSQTVARKKALMDVGMFDEERRLAEDFDLWVRMAHHGAQMAYQNKVLGRYRQRPGGQSRNPIKSLEGAVQALRDFERSLDLTPAELAVVRGKAVEIQAWCEVVRARECLRAGRTHEAAAAYERANGFYHKTTYRLVSMALRIAPQWTTFGLRTFERWRSGLKPA